MLSLIPVSPYAFHLQALPSFYGTIFGFVFLGCMQDRHEDNIRNTGVLLEVVFWCDLLHLRFDVAETQDAV
ncbi:MAG: hypothetical protein R3333_12885 [Lishizhenia sp.]|nr:hypothetical protein [Lishizhenia sp.]MDX1447077.1 hypothetical protein [Lishizhenia sp.]